MPVYNVNEELKVLSGISTNFGTSGGSIRDASSRAATTAFSTQRLKGTDIQSFDKEYKTAGKSLSDAKFRLEQEIQTLLWQEIRSKPTAASPEKLVLLNSMAKMLDTLDTDKRSKYDIKEYEGALKAYKTVHGNKPLHEDIAEFGKMFTSAFDNITNPSGDKPASVEDLVKAADTFVRTYQSTMKDTNPHFVEGFQDAEELRAKENIKPPSI